MGAVYTGSFEMRKLFVRWARAVGGGVTEDYAICTFHLLKIVGGSPSSAWVTADYTAAEARFDTFWTSCKPSYGAHVVLSEYRWFKSGPAWEPKDAPNPVNPAERTTIRNVPGTSAVGTSLPPQIASTLTERVPIRKRWGRVYLPAPDTANCSSVGRVGGSGVFALAFAVTMYNGWRTDGLKPVVWSRGRGAHTTDAGTDVPDHDAAAYEIDSLQADNVWDVIRSRRYESPTVRTNTALT